jgi:hypothetical protein
VTAWGSSMKTMKSFCPSASYSGRGRGRRKRPRKAHCVTPSKLLNVGVRPASWTFVPILIR